MQDFYKFVKAKNLSIERVEGRDHEWHYNPEITKLADSILVKVIMVKGGIHDFHQHPEMNEILYILKGKAEQWIEDEMQILEAGDSVYIDQGVVHATLNASEEALEFLAVLTPASGWEAGTLDESKKLPYSEYRK